MRLWPDTLAGRTSLLLVISVLVLVAVAGMLLNKDRRETFRSEREARMVERIVTLYQVLDQAPAGERAEIVTRFNRDGLQLALSDRAQSPERRGPGHPLRRYLSHRLREQLPQLRRGSLRISFGELEGSEVHEHHEKEDRLDDDDVLLIDMRLADGSWVNLRLMHERRPPPWAVATLLMLTLVVLLVGLAGYLVSRRLSQPMRELATAADRFGAGGDAEEMAEKGPREVRHTIRAFNRMQARIERNLRERSLMLAAVSHDLRTPITTLRLRAEYIEDQEMRERTLATLEQMENILGETLAFARDEGADQRKRRFDLAALLQTLCDDYNDMDERVSCELPQRLIIEGRVAAIQRAVSNLVGNALRYAGSAELRLRESGEWVVIEVLDRGPGIPGHLLEEVFTPFFRVEGSRSSETGGIGLGLAITRLLVLAQGGSVHLVNREPSGLRAEIRLQKLNANAAR